MKSRKNMIIISFVTIFLLIASIGIGIFAYYSLTDNGWGQKIVTTNVKFKVNGQTIIDDATSYDLGLLERGDSAEVALEVVTSASANNSVFTQYNINLSTQVQDTENQDLAKAIEVYKYIDGQYRFVSTLSELDIISNVLPANATDYLYYKFVYSPTASNYFEDKDFTLRLNADAEVYSGHTDRIIVNNATSFVDAISNGQNEGSTLTLTSDITLSSQDNLIINHPINIDLAGNTLKLDGVSLTMNVANATARIQNSSPESCNIVIENGGQINYILNNALVLIDDSMQEFYSIINVQDIRGAEQANFDKLILEIERQLEEVSGDVKFKNDLIDFTQGLKYYFLSPDEIAPKASISIPTNNIVVPKNDATYQIPGVYEEIMTKTQMLSFMITQSSLIKYVNVGLTIRGNSDVAITQYWLEQVPDVISSSVYFASHDNSTNSTLTWITDNDDVLSNYGIYLPNGYLNLDSYSDTTVGITLIVNNGQSQFKLHKEVLVALLTAEQKTNELYNYEQLLATSKEGIIDVYTNNILKKDLVGKTGLRSIRIAPETTGSEAIFNEYFEKSSEEHRYDVLSVKKLPAQHAVVTIPVQINFIYSHIANDIRIQTNYVVITNITLLGPDQSGGFLDPAFVLQREFSINSYINGNDYQFNVMAKADDGVNVDYFVKPDYQNYVTILNDHMIANNKGSHILYRHEGKEDYYWRYSYEDFSYQFSNNGNYILVGNEYIEVPQNLIVNNTYDRYALVTILPRLVPSVPMTTVEITIKLWEQKNSSGEKVYIKDDADKDIESLVKLNVQGLYQNTPEDIADYGLYTKLLSIYDVDGDGWISVMEASYRWSELPEENQNKLIRIPANGTLKYRYIDFSNLYIQDIKGIEYFEYIEGLNFDKNIIVNIKNLDNLLFLKYLVLDNNQVAYLDSLAFLDRLEHLSIRNLPISRLDDIRYLPNIKYLNMKDSSVISYEPLTDYNNLTGLDIRGGTASTSNETQYYLALIYKNNRNNRIEIFNDEHATPAWTSQDSHALNAIVAGCTVLSQMVVADEAYTTLNVPNTYDYRYLDGNTWVTKKYNIVWEADTGQDYLEFTQDKDGKTNGYIIKSPIVDTEIGITVKVVDTITIGGNAVVITLTQKVLMNILQSQQDDAIPRIETEEGSYQVASAVVKDSALLELLFDIFNTNTNTDKWIDGTEFYEKYTLTYSEITTPNKTDHGWRFKDRNISSLEGIQYFAEGIAFVNGLDLRNNTLDKTLTPDAAKGEFSEVDLSPLSALTSLSKIRLSGQLYDFSQISGYNRIDGGSGTTSGLTQLQEIYVSGSFDLDSEVVLTSLYEMYLSNTNCVIYIEGDPSNLHNIAWNPYEELLDKAMSKLPTTYHFKQMGATNNLYGADAAHDDRFIINAYGLRDVPFSFSSYVVTSEMLKYITVDSTTAPKMLTYKKYAATSFADHILLELTGDDGKDNTITAKHMASLKFELYSNIIVVDFNENIGKAYCNTKGNAVECDDVTHIANKVHSDDMFYAFNIHDDARCGTISKCTDHIATGDGYIALDKIFPSISLRGDVMTRLQTIFNTADKSKNSIKNIVDGYYSPNNGDHYYITKATLFSLWDGHVATDSHTFTSIYVENETNSQIKGLKYLNIAYITIKGNSNLGDGSELINVQKLRMFDTYVSFAGITTDLPKMRDIILSWDTPIADLDSYMGSNAYAELYSYDKNNNIYYNMAHFKNIEILSLQASSIYDWNGLRCFAVPGESNSIRELKIHGTANHTTGQAKKRSNYNTTQDSTVAIITAIYKNSTADNKDYRIGSPTDPNDYIHEFDPDNKAWGVTDPTEIKQQMEEDYLDLSGHITDLGATVNGDPYVNNTKQSLTDNAVLSLPWNTSQISFGLFGSNNSVENNSFAERKFSIEWNVVSIDAATAKLIFGVDYPTKLDNGSQYVTLSTPTSGINSNINYTLNAQPYDVYFILTGVIGNGYYYGDNNTFVRLDNNTPRHYYSNPILLKGTAMSANGYSASATISYDTNSKDTISSSHFYNVEIPNIGTATYLSYQAFDCLEMRVTMAKLMSQFDENKSPNIYALPGTMLYSISGVDGNIGVAGITKLEYNVNSNEFSATMHDRQQAVKASVGTKTELFFGENENILFKEISGIEFFLSLRNIKLNDMYITSLSPLQELSKWQNRTLYSQNQQTTMSIEMRSNGIEDITPLAAFTNISILNLGDNNIQTLHNGTFILSKSLGTLQKLILDNNYELKYLDVNSLLDAMKNRGGEENLRELDLSNISAEYSETLLSVLANIASNVVGGEIDLTINGGIDPSFSSNTYNNFIEGLENDKTYKKYLEFGYNVEEVFYFTDGTTGNMFKIIDGEFLGFNGEGIPSLTNGIPKGTKLTMKISHSASEILSFYKEIVIHDPETISASPTMEVDGTLRKGSDFDPILWLAMVRFSKMGAFKSPDALVIEGIPDDESPLSTLEYARYALANNANIHVLTIYTNDINSLDGIQHLTKLKYLEINNSTSITTSLFPNITELTNVKHFELSNSPSIDEKILMDITKMTKLEGIYFSKQNNLDYSKNITIKAADRSKSYSTLANVIGYSLPHLENLEYNNLYQMGVFNESDLHDSVLQHYNGENYIFNLTKLVGGENAKKIKSFKEIVSMVQTKNNKSVDLYSFAFASTISRSIFDINFKQQSNLNVYDFRDAMEKALLFKKDVFGREIFPDTVRSNGVIFYLPTDTYFDNKLIDITWIVEGVDGTYLDKETNVFSINSGNLIDSDIGRIFTLTATLAYGSRELITMSKEINIEEDIEVKDPKSLAPYYVETSPNNFVEANTIFKGSDLMQKIFIDKNTLFAYDDVTKKYTEIVFKDYIVNNKVIGSYLAFDDIKTVYKLNLGSLNTIQGIELFHNTKEIILNNNGLICLAPLREMQLISFKQTMSLVIHQIVDYSPLVNSADTLKVFHTKVIGHSIYPINAPTTYKYLEDLSFLLMFSALTNVDLAFDSFSGDFEPYHKQIIEYVLRFVQDWYAANPNNAEGNRIVFDVRYGKNYYTIDDHNKYAMHNHILSSYDTSGDFDISIFRNAMLKIINDTKPDGTPLVNETLTLKAPAYISSLGGFYEAYYKISSTDAQIGRTIYQGQTFSTIIDGVNKTYSEGSEIVEGEMDKILKTSEGTYILMNSKGSFYKEIIIPNYTTNQDVAFVMELGIVAEDYYSFRHITLYGKTAWSVI